MGSPDIVITRTSRVMTLWVLIWKEAWDDGPLMTGKLVDCYRIVTFVPVTHLEAVIDALSRSDLLVHGNYKDVLWFSAPGTGQFTPTKGARPAQGEIGVRERCAEVRLEFAIEKNTDDLNKIVHDVIRPAHPWEEPAIAVYETQEFRS